MYIDSGISKGRQMNHVVYNRLKQEVLRFFQTHCKDWQTGCNKLRTLNVRRSDHKNNQNEWREQFVHNVFPNNKERWVSLKSSHSVNSRNNELQVNYWLEQLTERTG